MTAGLAQFIDIHSHILPGLDDGPKDFAQSIAMARAYTAAGITRVIATPHFIPGTAWAASAGTVLSRVDALNDRYRQEGIALEVYPGMEVAFHAKLPERLAEQKVLPLGSSSSYLIEPPFGDVQEPFLRCMHQLLDGGYSIIIAHPERVPSFQRRPGSLFSLAQQGGRIQLNMGSLFNRYGSSCRRLAQDLLERDLVYCIASDAHGVARRKPPTGKERLELESLLGTEMLTVLSVSNPSQLLSTVTNSIS